MIKINNPYKMFFSSDDEFYNFCVVPVLVTRESTNPNTGETIRYFDFDFTYEYLNALKNGVQFIIKDEDSQIFKHGAVSYRTITKPVQNLKQYFNKYNRRHGN